MASFLRVKDHSHFFLLIIVIKKLVRHSTRFFLAKLNVFLYSLRNFKQTSCLMILVAFESYFVITQSAIKMHFFLNTYQIHKIDESKIHLADKKEVDRSIKKTEHQS